MFAGSWAFRNRMIALRHRAVVPRSAVAQGEGLQLAAAEGGNMSRLHIRCRKETLHVVAVRWNQFTVRAVEFARDLDTSTVSTAVPPLPSRLHQCVFVSCLLSSPWSHALAMRRVLHS